LSIYTFTKADINNWIYNLKVILKEDSNLSSDINNLDTTLSPSDIYNTDKINIPLPLGSFSRIDGVFIPVPSYFNKNGDLIHSHWVFKRGMWDGQAWNDQWYPRLSSFIQNRGEKNKIYYENGGYWIYESTRGINIIYLINLIYLIN